MGRCDDGLLSYVAFCFLLHGVGVGVFLYSLFRLGCRFRFCSASSLSCGFVEMECPGSEFGVLFSRQDVSQSVSLLVLMDDSLLSRSSLCWCVCWCNCVLDA